jgi:hemerythrin
MMEASLPTLFGRATAILGEHDQLHGTVVDLRAECLTLRAGQAPTESDLTDSLRDLLRRLRRHFAREESDGYFGTLIEAGLNLDVARLETEHTEMIDTLLELLKIAETGDTPRAARGLLGLLEQFEAHEQRETQLMQEFLLSGDAAAGS